MNAGKLIGSLLLTAAMLPGMAAAQSGDPAALSVLPRPAKVAVSTGSFSIKGAALAASDPGARAAGQRFAALMAQSGHGRFAFAPGGAIRLVRDASISAPEGYRLTVDARGATISASSDAGLYYGAETLWQLAVSKQGQIPALTIEDKPAYRWRGVMLDSARHMQGVDFIRELIDRMALAKLNRLHWHLTDDQGWRLPVPAYPRLTSHGAWRTEAGETQIDPKTGRPVKYGGFYTAQQIRDLVAYAASRHIEIVPEIDIPGHATAAVAAYPSLASTPNPPAVASPDWGILPNLIVPDERGLTFVKTVLDEVFRLFPGRYVHVGGDEAAKDQWNANPAIRAQMEKLGVKDANGLQAWFVGQIADYVAAHGRRTVGWDEILDGPVPGDAVVMSWRGASGALKAARAGHDTVLAPAPDYYLDNKQSASDREPSGRGAVVSWRRLYEFDPGLAALDSAEAEHVMGMQVNLWTEHVRTSDYARLMLWPRAAILADLAWTGTRGDWAGFAPRLAGHIDRDKALGWASSEVSLDAMARFALAANGTITVTLDQPAAIGTLHYTLDGSAPTAQSPVYSAPLSLSEGTKLSVQGTAAGKALGTVQRWPVTASLARTLAGNDMETCHSGITLRMEDAAPTDGVRRIHQADIMDGCWIWRGATLAGTRKVTAAVGARPFNFSLMSDIASVKLGKSDTPAGELRIRQDSCEGPLLATIPLGPLAGKQGVGTVSGDIEAPLSGAHDLCITLSRKQIDPLWVLDRLTFTP